MAELDTTPAETTPKPQPETAAPDDAFSTLDTTDSTFGGLLSGDAFKKTSFDLASEYKKYEASQSKVTVQQARIAKERDDRLQSMLNAEGATSADMQPFNQEAASAKHSHNLWEQFGSPGFIFGMLASSFTGMPMTNALNAGAAAMRAINEGDIEGYHREFDTWKTNTDLAIKRFNMEKDAFDQIEHLYKNKLDEWHAAALANAARFDDRKAQILLENGMYPDLLKAREEQFKLMEDAQKARDQLEANHTKQLIVDSIIKDDDGKVKYDLHKNPQILVQAKMAADLVVDGKSINPEQQAVQQLVLSDEWKNASAPEKIKKLTDLKTNFLVKASHEAEEQRKWQVIHDDELTKDPKASEAELIERTNKRLADAKKATPTVTPKQAAADREREVYTADEKEKDPNASEATILDRVNKRIAEMHHALSIRSPQAMYMKALMDENKNMKPEEIRRNMALYVQATAAARTLATREANVRTNIREAIGTATLALAASENMDRGDFVPLTEMQYKVARGTSSPEMRAFIAADQSFKTAYAQTMSRTGQTTVHSQEISEKLLDPAEGPEAYAAGIRQMKLEMNTVLQAVEDTEAEMIGGKKPAEITNFRVVK